MTDKAALADGDVLADKGMGLNFTVRADAGIPWISTNGPTKTLSAELAIIEVGGLVNNDIFPQTTLRTPVSRSSGIVPLKSVLARICKVLCWLAEWKIVSLMCCILAFVKTARGGIRGEYFQPQPTFTGRFLLASRRREKYARRSGGQSSRHQVELMQQRTNLAVVSHSLLSSYI